MNLYRIMQVKILLRNFVEIHNSLFFEIFTIFVLLYIIITTTEKLN